MNVPQLPLPMVCAYMAGRAAAYRDDWMRRAAQADDRDLRRIRVRNAREHNHWQLRYLALARKALAREALLAGN